MIQEFVDVWYSHMNELEEYFKEHHPDSYKDLVMQVIKMLNKHSSDYHKPDPERLYEIDDGDYQGTLLYIIGDCGYQPSDYWYVKVCYGSCSGCDTLQAIRDYSGGHKPTESQIRDYMTLCLHIIQKLKKMDDNWV